MNNTEFDVLVDDIFTNYKGAGDDLTRAMGSMVVAHRMGWEVLLIMVSEATFKRHEKILGLNFKEVFERRGVFAQRSLGIKITDKMQNFWNIVQGKQKMDRFQRICIE
jgi:hypothetical protein